jgi:hypothetical protein
MSFSVLIPHTSKVKHSQIPSLSRSKAQFSFKGWNPGKHNPMTGVEGNFRLKKMRGWPDHFSGAYQKTRFEKSFLKPNWNDWKAKAMAAAEVKGAT